jgi:hypothetical protein
MSRHDETVTLQSRASACAVEKKFAHASASIKDGLEKIAIQFAI